ncbi:EcsC family protein [Deinococcus sp.]|uniref:EcsC family protein n=1 Tax=Deinococcus sp. TaxID=47478 RepID=UPI003C7E0A6A
MTNIPNDQPDDNNLGAVQQVVGRIVGTVAQRRGPTIYKVVAEARKKNPALSNAELAAIFIKRRAFYSGVSGGVTSLGGLITLPVTLPAGLASSLAFQAEIMLTVAHIYGHELQHEDRYLDFLLLFLGNNVHEVMKRLGVAAGTRLTRQVVDKLFTREVMNAIWRIVGKSVLTKAGTKSTFTLMKAVPFVAAPIGFAFDYTAARALGAAAILFYSHEDELSIETIEVESWPTEDAAPSPL